MSERQEREKRMLEFTTQINKLTEQINYQKSRLMNMQGSVSKCKYFSCCFNIRFETFKWQARRISWCFSGKIDKCEESVRKLKKDVEAVRKEEEKKAEVLERKPIEIRLAELLNRL